MGQQAEDRVPFTGGAGAGVCKGVTGGWPSFAVNMTRESSRCVEECYCIEATRGRVTISVLVDASIGHCLVSLEI